MLLCELTGVKHLHHKTWDELLDDFEKRGIKFIGGGKYGQVFSHPAWNYVIKVFEDDPYYMGFVDWVIAHPNKHFPRFSKRPLKMHKFYSRFSNDTNHFYVVKIEKLYPITDRALMEFLVYELERIGEAAWKKHNNHQYTYYNPNYTQRFPNGSMVKGATVEDVFKQYPWTESLGLAFSALWEAEVGHQDIHSGNIMQRKDGTIVIIDPVWQGETPEQAYYAFLRAESGDVYGEYDDLPMTSGPKYPHHKKQSPPKQKQEPYPSWDDIPF